MTQTDILTYTLPEYLASYLINGDASGLTEQEINEIDSFLKKEKISILSAGDEPFFKWRNDMNSQGATCLEYQAVAL
jgi:hypothetical protein